MPKATTKTKARSVEEAVSYAIGHRIRIEILAILNDGTHSPDELARLLREPLSKITHHLKELLESRSIEIARVEKVRNVTQNFYRTAAVDVAYLSDEAMAKKTAEERHEFYGLALQASMTEALASFWAGKITDDPRAWLAWCWFNVDAQGRNEIADEMAASWERIVDIEDRATARRAKSGEEAVSMVVTTFAHERSRSAASTLRARKNLP